MIGIIGAMQIEIDRILERVEAPVKRVESGIEYVSGKLLEQDAVVAKCGIGKVNAAALTQALLAAGARRLVFTGVAGAVDPALRVGDVVVSRDAVQHDVDVTGLGYALGEVPGTGTAWDADPALVAAARAAAAELPGVKVLVGRVASGDTFVADAATTERLRRDFDAACTEMEGAAVAQVCHRWGVPFVIVRSVSDSADHDAEVSFRAFTEVAAANADRVVRGLLRRLG